MSPTTTFHVYTLHLVLLYLRYTLECNEIFRPPFFYPTVLNFTRICGRESVRVYPATSYICLVLLRAP